MGFRVEYASGTIKPNRFEHPRVSLKEIAGAVSKPVEHLFVHY
jgi:hypothetical protein